MKVEITPGTASGSVCAPPSKSMTHRALICAFLSGGQCKIDNIAYSADITATIGALRTLGADIAQEENSVIFRKTGGLPHNTQNEIFCNESGSTLRFMIPLCLLTGRRITLSGSARLFSRSLSVYEQLCHERGFEFEQKDSSLTVCGRLSHGTYRVRGDISSQFISGLMFVLPVLSGDSVIEITGKAESMPYIKMTAQTLSQFGVTVSISDSRIEIPGNQRYCASDCRIEGDWSNAAFFLALNSLPAYHAVKNNVRVTEISKKSLQGDRICTEYFDKITRCAPQLDISDCPDLGPVLMSAMAANHGGTLTGTRRLKIKESDRGCAMASELAKSGVQVKVNENSIEVGHGLCPPTAPLCGHNDHRIVMALAVLCTVTGGVIDDAQAVNKSMPDFFEKLETLGIGVKEVKTDET